LAQRERALQHRQRARAIVLVNQALAQVLEGKVF
jgi:hypothetical protein